MIFGFWGLSIGRWINHGKLEILVLEPKTVVALLEPATYCSQMRGVRSALTR